MSWWLEELRRLYPWLLDAFCMLVLFSSSFVEGVQQLQNSLSQDPTKYWPFAVGQWGLKDYHSPEQDPQSQQSCPLHGKRTSFHSLVALGPSWSMFLQPWRLGRKLGSCWGWMRMTHAKPMKTRVPRSVEDQQINTNNTERWGKREDHERRRGLPLFGGGLWKNC